MSEFFHSVTLEQDKCKGCTNCIKRCPTQAIRVRQGKAIIITERCIDCGECIRVCPYHAKKAVYDNLSRLEEFRYNIALPAPTLYGQFNNLDDMDDIDYVLAGLLDIGFDAVFEVAKAAEIISDATRKLLREKKLTRPVINSACPAVVRLIRINFPDLCENVLPLIAPIHAAGMLAKREAQEKTGYAPEEIGVFFITPCPAKVTDIRSPLGQETHWVDGAFSIADIYPRLLEAMNRVQNPAALAQSGIMGVSWASSGGEAAALLREKYLAADGIENVIAVLEELEQEQLQGLDYIELNACRGGCVGGVLTVANPYVAKARLQSLRKYLPVSPNHLQEDAGHFMWDTPLSHASVLQLSPDLEEAIRMMNEIDRLRELLPDLDCGSCGAPSCRCLAEDIVKGFSHLNDCVFLLRQEAESAGIRVSPTEQQEPQPKAPQESSSEVHTL